MISLLLLLSLAHADRDKHCLSPRPPIQQPIVTQTTTTYVNNYSYTAQPDDQTHLAAHVGTAFAIQTVAYGVNRSLGMSKTAAEALGLVETLAIGLIYKSTEHASGKDTLRATEENALGAGLAIMTHITFSF